MLSIIREAQFALGALSQLLALSPAGAHGRVAGVLDAIGSALQLGSHAAESLPTLVEGLSGLRREIEVFSEPANRLTDADLARALMHLQSASTRFRSAIANRQSLT